MLKKAKILLLISLFLMISTSVIAEESTPLFGLNFKKVDEKGHIVLDLPAGEDATETMVLANFDDKNYITATLSIEDYSENPKENILKEWVKFSTKEMVLKPKESKELEYIVSIPKDTAAGTYRGSITATMTSYSDKPIDDKNSSSAAVVKVLYASAGNLRVNVTNGNTAIASTEEDKGESSEKPFFQDNWKMLVGGLILIAIIGMLITKFKLNTKKR